ncbi:potassium channel family protein [Mariniluteicoccus flavus]
MGDKEWRKKSWTRSTEGAVLVVGLGRFGLAAALELVRMDQEVLAVDERPELVQRYANELTHVIVLDSTDAEALEQIGAGSYERAIVAIGTDIEASIMTVLALSEAGVGDIWAKAITRKHGEILARVGAHHVVYPERTMGQRVAHQVAGNMSDYIQFEDGFSLARTEAPELSWGKSLGESVIRSKFDVTIVGVKRHGEDFTYARPETVVERGDELIVAGRTDLVEGFCLLR